MREIRSERFRQKVLKLLDGRGDLIHHAFHLNNMVHGEKIADYLLTRGITGEKLSAWLVEKHNNSFLKAVAYIIADVNKTNGVKPILVGRDYAQ